VVKSLRNGSERSDSSENNINVSFFDNDSSVQQLVIENAEHHVQEIDVVKMEFLEAQSMPWEELFDGFDKLYVITYSSGIEFTCDLLKKFIYSEIIFGCEDVISYTMQEIMAYQQKTVERIKNYSKKSKVNLLAMIDDAKLNLYVSHKKLSHEKVYLLESNDGRRRVIMGSANMSRSAFTGKQRENICYIDGDKAFEWYKDSFEQFKMGCTDNITKNFLSVTSEGGLLDGIPIMESIKVKKVLVIEPRNDLKDEVKFAYDMRNISKKLTPYMPKADKKGKILLSSEEVIKTKRRIRDAEIQEKELRSEYPQLIMDVETGTASLNDMTLDLTPEPMAVKRDVDLFLEYMDGYDRFHGDVLGMQARYYEFANWIFVSPFMGTMRNYAKKNNHNTLPYPVFGLLYGQSKAGKTSFLETLLKMMIGQKPKISAPEFTRSRIESLKKEVRGAPIIVDDLSQTRFSQHAIETIKDDEFGMMNDLLHYPAVVISANEDVKAVAPEVIRRTVICRVQAGLTNTELMKSNTVRKVQKEIGTDFYREYLRRMMVIIPQLLNDLNDDEADGAPDILAASSKVIMEILRENIGDKMPQYARELTLDDYFSERVTGAYAIKTIKNAWKVSKNTFHVERKLNELRYNAGQTWEAERILKELPEDLEAHKVREYIVMELDKACSFFGIDFKKRNLSDLFLRKS
jgi:hypothetical protein